MPVFYSPLPDMQMSLAGSVFTNNRTADGDFTTEQEDTSGWLAVISCSVDGGGRGRGFIIGILLCLSVSAVAHVGQQQSCCNVLVYIRQLRRKMSCGQR